MDRRTARSAPRSHAHPTPPAVIDLTEQVAAQAPVFERDYKSPHRAQLQATRRTLIIGDFLIAAGAAVVAGLVRFGADLAASSSTYLVIGAVLPFIWVAFLASSRAYEDRFVTAPTDSYRRCINAGIRFVATAAFLSWLANAEFARGYALVAFPLTIGGALLLRAVLHTRTRLAHRRGLDRQRVVVIGTERASAEFIRRLSSAEDHALEVVGVLVDVCQTAEVEGAPLLGTSRDVLHALKVSNADTLAIAPWSTYTQEDLKRLLWQLEGTGVTLVVAPNLSDVAGPRITVHPTAGMPLLHVEEPEFSGPRRILKAIFDRTTAAFLMIVLSPVLLAIAIAIKVDSRGSVFFKQSRVGLDGVEFKMVKFRSMVADADARVAEVAALNVHGDGPLLKVHDDPRITGIGRFIRRTSLDELPQLWNVVKGEMSLVGPRPPLPREVAEYDTHVHRRFLVPPGITGLWQVSGRSDLSWQESVRLDLSYVENWSIALDISILLRTVGVVLRGSGAY